jgi:hypothetical protein
MNTTTHFPNRGNTTNHPVKLMPCGTMSAYRRHYYRGEPVDALCKAASRKYYEEWRDRNRETNRSYHKEWSARYNTSQRKFEKRLKKYNLTVEDYAWMLYHQGFACAVCKSTEPGGNGNEWSIDHDHACCPEQGRSCGRCVRGLLCMSCNHGLGSFGDNEDSLRAALLYLEASRCLIGVG